MITFLPYADFTRSAQCLDRQRLGKQRLEAYQILRVLVGLETAWQHHPAVRMWRGHERCLFLYAVIVCREWRGRGYRDSMLGKLFSEILPLLPPLEPGGSRRKPSWLNDEFCRSHRSNLLRKDGEHYGRFGWDVPADLPYVWPV